MAFERLNHCNHTIMTAHPQVIPLGDVMGKDYSRALADSREHGKQNTSLKGLGLINNYKGVVQGATADMGQGKNLN
jgi:hypothetical protein